MEDLVVDNVNDSSMVFEVPGQIEDVDNGDKVRGIRSFLPFPFSRVANF
jgi:hypothetical protein